MASLMSLTRKKRNSRSVVGLDIEPGFVAAVEASVNGSVLVKRAAGAPLDLGVMREGEVIDVDALADVLRDLFHESHMGTAVRLGLANQRTVLRTLELPPLEDAKELAAAVRFQAEDEVPMPLANAVLDFHPLGIVDTPAGPRLRVVLVAAQRDMVERLLSAVRAAGLRPMGVDLAAFAMIRALYRADRGPDRLVYLNVGGLTNMAVAEGPTCRFTRVLGGGLEAMATEVADRGGIPLVQARQRLLRVGMIDPGTPAEDEPSGTPAEPGDMPGAVTSEDATEPLTVTEPNDSESPAHRAQEIQQLAAARSAAPAPVAASNDGEAEVRRVLARGVRDIAGEVRNSLDFQQSQDGGEQVAAVVLSGLALEIPGFSAELERELGIPVQRSTVGSVDDKSAGLISVDRLAVAAGLATEEVSA